MNTLKETILTEIKNKNGITFNELDKLSFCDTERLREVLKYLFNDCEIYEKFEHNKILIKPLLT